MSFLHIDMTQVLEILYHVRQELTFPTLSISWVLMSWRREEPRNQRPWYLLCWNGLIGSPYVRGKLEKCHCDRFDMMTSSNGNIFRVTGPLCGEFTGPGEFPTQRPVTRSFDVLFDLRLNKRLCKQPWGWWIETPSWSLWRQCNELREKIIIQWIGACTPFQYRPSFQVWRFTL